MHGSPGRPRKTKTRPFGCKIVGSTCLFKVGGKRRIVFVLSGPHKPGTLSKYLVKDLETEDSRFYVPRTLVSGEVIWNIDKDELKNISTNAECSICLEPYEIEKMLPCKHPVCSTCWMKWSDSLPNGKATCPMCREKVPWLYAF